MNQKDLDPDRLLDELVEWLGGAEVPPYPFPKEQSSAPTAAAQDKVPRSVFQKATTIGTRRAFQLTASAVVLLIVAGALWTLSFPRANVVFAFEEVQKAVSAAKLMTCRVETAHEDRLETESHTIMIWGKDRLREDYKDFFMVFNRADQLEMDVIRAKRMATIRPLGPHSIENITSWLDKLLEVRGATAKEIARRVEQERLVIDFSVRMDDGDETTFIVTVDAGTKLPIRAVAAGKARGTSWRTTVRDFVFDAPIDESLFRIEAPPGYEVVRENSPRDEGDWKAEAAIVVSPSSGIGPIPFGARADEIVRKFGEPSRRCNLRGEAADGTAGGAPNSKPVGTDLQELRYERRGFGLILSETGLGQVRCFEGFKGKTSEGVRIGTLWEDVLKTYGEPEHKTDHYLHYPALGWEFFFAHERLEQISFTAPGGFVKLDRIQDEGPGRFTPRDEGVFDPVLVVPYMLAGEHERLQKELRKMQVLLKLQQIGGVKARRDLEALEQQLAALRADIDALTIQILPFETHKETETVLFEFGHERLLVINANKIRVEGWAGPQIKCVLEKTVLTKKGDQDNVQVQKQMHAIKVLHQHARAPGVVGQSRDEQEAAERIFLATPAGLRMTDAERKRHRASLDETASAFALYREFQGNEFDMLEIGGLNSAADEPNHRNPALPLEAEWDGGSLVTSVPQRQAELTVFVPACQALALRGCLAGLDVNNVQGSLLVTRDGSEGHHFGGHFQIRNVQGALTVDNVPLDLVDSVQGNVRIISTRDSAAVGDAFGSNEAPRPPPRELTCQNISGNLTAFFGRCNLQLRGISGRLDVRNEFGDTTLFVGEKPAPTAHRVVSESGRIDIHLKLQVMENIPFLALTSYGAVLGRWAGGLSPAPKKVVRRPDGTVREWSGWWFGIAGQKNPNDNTTVEDRATVDLVAPPGHEGGGSPRFDVLNRAGIIDILIDE